MDVRIGIGYDIHRLVEGRRLVMGGVEFDSPVGFEAHSDGDVVLHAVTDAILGATGKGDLGEHFPDRDPQWKDANSAIFLQHAVALASERGLTVGNVDLNVLAERPRLGPAKNAIRQRLAQLLDLANDRVNVKARTMEGLGSVGRGEAIACQAVVTLVSPDPA